jgi:hypothetical protein
MSEDNWPQRREPFQFGLKHLLAMPLVFALLFAVIALMGVGPGAFLILVASFALTFYLLKSWTERIIVVAVFLILGVVLLPAAMNGSGQGAARRMVCSNNLKQLGLALHNYHQTYGCFPPAYVADEDGRPMHHSWRVLVLPFLEQQQLYDQYRFDEPWDGPNNRKLAENVISIFHCPEDGEKSPMTS